MPAAAFASLSPPGFMDFISNSKNGGNLVLSHKKPVPPFCPILLEKTR
jgi:hypothetical protein